MATLDVLSRALCRQPSFSIQGATLAVVSFARSPIRQEITSCSLLPCGAPVSVGAQRVVQVSLISGSQLNEEHHTVDKRKPPIM